MADNTPPNIELPDPEQISANIAKVAEQSQKLVQEFVARQASGEHAPYQVLDPTSVGKAFAELTQHMWQNPAKVIEHQMAMWQDFIDLSARSARQALGEDVEPVAAPEPGDRRFKDDAWQDNPLFDYIKQSYLIAARHVLANVQDVEGMDRHTAQKVDFLTRQFVDAMAPTNFASTNPQVVRETLESGGQNLLKGLSNMLADLDAGKGKLRVRMTDAEAFELGKNVAVTPGKVVYQNDLMQLLQYAPATEQVQKRPLLIIPPWINKFYILDLRPKNSFIKWAVDQGHTVFVISWVNPDEKLADKTFEDYMFEGPLAALDAIAKATGVAEVKAIGYCLGGTLLAGTLAYMTAKDDKRIKAATFFTTMTDFSEPGELGVFIDEEQLAAMEKEMQEKGYFEGSAMAEAFNLLRANDLIWSFVINNYLLGKDPFPFDLLYWNSDSTRMPREMHRFYLRNMYQKNLLCQPGGIALGGVPIDLTTIKTPAYILSTKEDHIAPWKSTYAATQLYAGPVRFVLGGSGHIAGVINPPAANKYAYQTSTANPPDPEQWLRSSSTHEGSWWSDWNKWVARYNGGKQVGARQPGDGELAVLEDAPGSYVKGRA